MQPMVSTYCGEHRGEGMRNVRRYAFRYGCSAGCLAALLIFLFPQFICVLFGLREAAAAPWGQEPSGFTAQVRCLPVYPFFWPDISSPVIRSGRALSFVAAGRHRADTRRIVLLIPENGPVLVDVPGC